jgi:DNA-binding transcriptional LysR family regulator
MDLRQLRYAIALSEELSFTLAAKRCGISQPTLTNAIRKLERELGMPLFERRPKVALSPFGSQVLPLLYRIEGAVKTIADVAAGAGNPPAGPPRYAAVLVGERAS